MGNKMKIPRSFRSRRLALALLTLGLVPFEAHASECGDKLKSSFSFETYKNQWATCQRSPSPPCRQVYEKIKSAVEAIHRDFPAHCEAAHEVDVSGQSDALDAQKDLLLTAISGVTEMEQQLSNFQGQLRQPALASARKAVSLSNAATLDPAHKTLPKKYENFFRSEKMNGRLPSIKASSISKQTSDRNLQAAYRELRAAADAAEFVKRLKEESSSMNTTLASLQNKLNETDRRLAELRDPPPDKDDDDDNQRRSLVSRMDPNTMMGLATAGMGLAGMLMQKKESDVSSGDPAPMPHQTPATSALGDSASPTGVVVGGQEKKEDKKEGGTEVADSVPIFPYEADSGISSGEEPTTSKRDLAGSGLSTGASGGDAGMGADGDSGETQAENTVPKAGANAGTGDETLGAFGGGLGGPMSSSSPFGEEPGADPMKDLIKDMENVAGGDPGLDGGESFSGGESQASEESALAAVDGLFPRVRAAYMRSLKRGLVLNGLGEKIE
jgi:hypothetical protein